MATILTDMHRIEPNIEQYDFENIIEKYASSKGRGTTDATLFFNQLWMPFCWAAIIGFQNDTYQELEGSLKRNTFNYGTINNQSEKIFNTLVLYVVAKKGYEILETPLEINKVIEQYANGGFEIIYEKINEKRDFFNHADDYYEFLLENLKAPD